MSTTKLMALCGVMVASACGAPSRSLYAGSTLDPREASAFWCAATGQCFTEERDCYSEACFLESRASCAAYYDGGYPRFLCGIDEETCERLKDQLPVQDVGVCIMRAALPSTDTSVATTKSTALDPLEPVQASAPVAVAPPPAPAPAPVAQPAPIVVAPPAPPRADYSIAPSSIRNVEIEAAPSDAGGWDVHISNNSDTMVLVVWDESTFVTRGDQSTGRLIRTSAPRRDDQTSTPVAPHSRTTENVLVEKLFDGGAESIVGGRMVLTLQLPDSVQVWSGVVQPNHPAQPPQQAQPPRAAQPAQPAQPPAPPPPAEAAPAPTDE